MIKILHIIKSLGRGGAEMLLPETIQAHDQSRFQFHCLYFLPWKNQLADAINAAGGKVTCLAASNNLSLLFRARAIAHYCRQNQIDLIHAHLPWAGIAARIAGRLARLPVVYTEHNNFHRYAFLTRIASRVTYGWQTKVLTVSAEAKQVLDELRLHPDVEYVPNGVNTDKFERSKSLQPTAASPTPILTVGTVAVFRKQKRLDLWLEVAQLCRSQQLPFRFILVGDGPEREQLQSYAQVHNLDNVEFAGMQSDPRPWMAKMDLFLITSDFEGLPVALLEAMSMQVVPISTAVGGIPNVVSPNRNGYLLESSDPTAIVEKLREILSLGPNAFREMAEQARHTVCEQFSIQRMVRQLEGIYESILSQEKNQ